MLNNDKINERIRRVSTLNETGKNDGEKDVKKRDVIGGITKGEPEPDFKKIAEEIKKASDVKKSVNEGYVKDTLYIREDIYNAFMALCPNHGDKKQHINVALSDYVKKKYKELK